MGAAGGVKSVFLSLVIILAKKTLYIFVKVINNIYGGDNMVQLTQKEQMLLKDMKAHEEWCIKKYANSAELAQDPALKQTLKQIEQHERGHLNILNEIMSGQTPSVGQTQSQTSGQSNWQTAGFSNTQTTGMNMASSQGSKVEFGMQQPEAQQSQKPFPFSKQAQSERNVSSSQTASSQSQGQSTTQQVGTTGHVHTALQNDLDICYDLLNTEKYVSSAYNTAIFEFSNPSYRNALNHIQKEEQQHGYTVYEYISKHGGYA